MIQSFILRFLSSKAVTIVLMIACASAGAYITYVINEKSRLESQVETLIADNQSYKHEILLLNKQIEIYAKAEQVSKTKLKVNKVIIKELESNDKEVLAIELPNPLIKRMCELGQLTESDCT